jgi:hypothetical protein
MMNGGDFTSSRRSSATRIKMTERYAKLARQHIAKDRQHGSGNLEAEGTGEMRQGEHWLTMFASCSQG